MKLTTYEIIMFNILKKNAIAIGTTSGKYKAALQRLVRKGMARMTDTGWELSIRGCLK